ncbi:MAG: EAL domain-containing protein [Pseudomonadota bacterium]
MTAQPAACAPASGPPPQEALSMILAGRLRLAWQPVRAASGGPFFEEGLARLSLPCGGVVAAGGWVPALEAAGLSAPLDRAALDLALTRLGRERSLRLSVNLSAANLCDAGWHARLARAAREDADAARRLIVEVTETAEPDIDRLSAARRRIAACGPAVALDDFGAGHATASMALVLRPDLLKLDRRFAEDLRHGVSGAADRFAQARRFAALLDAPLIAEGAETPMEALRLIALGADGVQGYGVAEPALAADPAPSARRLSA